MPQKRHGSSAFDGSLSGQCRSNRRHTTNKMRLRTAFDSALSRDGGRGMLLLLSVAVTIIILHSVAPAQGQGIFLFKISILTLTNPGQVTDSNTWCDPSIFTVGLNCDPYPEICYGYYSTSEDTGRTDGNGDPIYEDVDHCVQRDAGTWVTDAPSPLYINFDSTFVFDDTYKAKPFPIRVRVLDHDIVNGDSSSYSEMISFTIFANTLTMPTPTVQKTYTFTRAPSSNLTYSYSVGCNTNYYGSDCKKFCSSSTNCSSNGVCTADGNACSCYSSYYGANCKTFCSSYSTCSSRGSCTANGTACTCNTNYYDYDCSKYCIASTTCSSHGSCAANGTCICNADYYGPSCSKYCSAASTCGGHGTCNSAGDCVCSGNFSLTTTPACSNCNSLFYGSTCQPCLCPSSRGTCNDTVSGNGLCRSCKSDTFATSICTPCECSMGGKCSSGPTGTGKCLYCNAANLYGNMCDKVRTCSANGEWVGGINQTVGTCSSCSTGYWGPN
eukprot:Opistho-2@93364